MVEIKINNKRIMSLEDFSEENTTDGKLLFPLEQNDVYISSDYHLCRYLIKDMNPMEYVSVKYETDRCIKLHNEIVGKDDYWINLGDLSEEEFGDLSKGDSRYREIVDAVKALNGKMILITGNNDTMSDDFYNEAGVYKIIRTDQLSKNCKNVYSHYPVNVSGKKLNLHGHIHGSHKYWGIDWHNHIDVYWKMWGGPKRISEFEEIYREGKYIGETLNIDSNCPESHDTHK